MDRSTGKKRNKTRIKRVSECLNDDEVEDLYNTLDICGDVQPILDGEIERLKEEINKRIFSLKLDVETDKNNLEFFERSIQIKTQEIERLIMKLNSLL